MQAAQPRITPNADLFCQEDNTFFTKELDAHLPQEIASAMINKFLSTKELFTHGCSLSYYGKIWNVRCDFELDSTEKIRCVFLRIHSSNEIRGYKCCNNRVTYHITGTLNCSIEHADLPDGLKDTLVNGLKNGELSHQKAPIVKRMTAMVVRNFFKTVPTLIPPTGKANPPPDMPDIIQTPPATPIAEEPPMDPSSYKPNRARYLPIVAIFGGIVYVISKYAQNNFASLKEISLGKSNYIATPQFLVASLCVSLFVFCAWARRERNRC